MIIVYQKVRLIKININSIYKMTCYFCKKISFTIPCENCFPQVNDFEEMYKKDDEKIVFYKRYLCGDTVHVSGIFKNGCGTNHLSMDEAKQMIQSLLNDGYELDSTNSKSGLQLYSRLLWHIFGYGIYKITGL